MATATRTVVARGQSLTLMDILQALKADYARFPQEQTYSLYADDVFFKDPLNQFRGIARYQQMIGFIARWFRNLRLDLHEIQRSGNTITTRWTLSWDAPLPWKPRISIPGWSELQVNKEEKISSHIDYWSCSRLDVVRQHFSLSKPE